MGEDRLYGMRIDENDEDENIKCDVCLEPTHESDDQMVICSLCNVGVHQSCHGGDIMNYIPVNDWFC